MLLEKIKTDMFEAKKYGHKEKGNLLSTLYAEAASVGKNAGNRASTDEEVIAVIKKFIKNLDEAIRIIDSLPSATTTHNLKGEKTVLESYLPKQLDREELEDIIFEQYKAGKNMGEIMKYLKENHAGLYDGKTASEIVKSLQ